MENEAHGRTIFWLLLKTALLSGLITLAILLLTASIIGFITLQKVSAFAKVAQVSLPELRQRLTLGWQTDLTHHQGHKTILILGVDELETRPGSPPLTDTMILININLKTGRLTAISLPRDLWHEEYKTKINALYIYGHERDPDNPLTFPQEALSELTGVPIHHAVVISMEKLAELVDLVEGVEIEVVDGFVDYKFPRGDVDVTLVTNPDLLFMTVNFPQGFETMNGERVLQYIRSRNSEGDQGTDLARAARQQQVISRLLSEVMSPRLWLNEVRAATLFRFYLDNFEQNLSLEEVIATGRAMIPHRKVISFSTENISVFPEDPNGVIYNPPRSPANPQWIYQIRDEDLFKQEFQNKLYSQSLGTK
jgi:LCP family protein required for cell wall assembly